MVIHIGQKLDSSLMQLYGQFIGLAVIKQVIVTPCCGLPEVQIVKLTSVNTAPHPIHFAEVVVYGF